MKTSIIILAAGKGTRMNSDLPKVLHKIAGEPMLIHAMAAGATVDPARTVLVTGHQGAKVAHQAQLFDARVKIAEQPEQLGTANAVAQARTPLQGFEGRILVLYGDTPFIRPETLARMLEVLDEKDVVVLGFEAKDPARYGRLVMDGMQLERIVEYKDASESERKITLCNSGVIACDAALLFDLIDAVDNNNASGEYYLTDIVGIARARGLRTTAVTCDEAETLGINARDDLAAAEAAFQTRARAEMMENGVTLVAPQTVYFARDTVIGRDTIVEPNVVFGPGVTVENGARIRAFSHLEGCHVSSGTTVGPYARLREGTELSENVRVGNFVEIKNAQIAEGAKVNHLTYIGDASIGAAANIGAGTVTCNYDGVMKHRTRIGAGAFIGSGTMLVAPVSVGEGALTGSGSVITSDVEADALALGRAHQVEKPGMARKLMEMLKAQKAKMERGS
ncbi:MAG: bifunctional UDP-N-acetylglucosamine diphosphorylase/glucosamine-1-phosphate N-acetyltransferase GlmU [Pseudomonadota bacterium]